MTAAGDHQDLMTRIYNHLHTLDKFTKPYAARCRAKALAGEDFSGE